MPKFEGPKFYHGNNLIHINQIERNQSIKHFKMRIFNHKLFSGLALALALPLAVSCGDDKDTPVDVNELPENTYPVEYTATLGGYGRVTADNQFDGTEDIYVESWVANSSRALPPRGDWATYKFSNGKLTTTSPAYWSRKDEERISRAYVIPKGTTQDSYLNLMGSEENWFIDKDQSKDLYARDLMFAQTRSKYGSPAALEFYHQLAKVEYVFKQQQVADYNLDLSTAKVGGANNCITGHFEIPSEGNKYVKWTSLENKSAITPFVKDNTLQVLLIPQALEGEDILTLNHNGEELSCKVDNPLTLESGKQYTYEVTVDISNGYLYAKLVSVGPWTDGESTDVDSSVPTEDYGPVKVGDYYYDDGSWSDGGFISYSEEDFGSIKWASPKPKPVFVNPKTNKERKVIGIIFSTDLSRMGDAEKAALRKKGIKEPHGLVMGTQIIDTYKWDPNCHDEREIGIPFTKGTDETPLYTLLNAQVSGLANCQAIRDKRSAAVMEGQYPLLLAIGTLEAPQTSTGWYVPAAAQWFDFLRNLTGLDFSDKCDFYFTSNAIYEDDGLHFDWQLDLTLEMMDKYKNVNYADRLNYAFSTIPVWMKTEFALQESLWTSSICNEKLTYYIGLMAGKFVTCTALNKDTWVYCRPVLAF